MGALHAGHLSLVKKSGNICRNTIVSIYLNPAQFSPDEDLDSYPNKVKNDIEGYLIGIKSWAKTIDLILENNGASNNGERKYSAFKLFINFGTEF